MVVSIRVLPVATAWLRTYGMTELLRRGINKLAILEMRLEPERVMSILFESRLTAKLAHLTLGASSLDGVPA